MKRFLTVAAVCLAFSVAGAIAGAQSATVAGDWEVTINTGQQVPAWHAILEQKGEVVSGTLKIGEREQFPIDGSIKGKELKLTFTLPDLDGDLSIVLNGLVEGDSIKGSKTDFAQFGVGDWTGTRTPPSK